jgi:hypothetical protein
MVPYVLTSCNGVIPFLNAWHSPSYSFGSLQCPGHVLIQDYPSLGKGIFRLAFLNFYLNRRHVSSIVLVTQYPFGNCLIACHMLRLE